MIKDLPHILRVFLTCPASGHSAASPAVTAYLHYADAARLGGTEPRSFRKWCFFGTRTRLFSYLRQTARAYGAPAELFTHRESGQRARRRMVQAGKLVEYLRRERLPDGTETWCYRHLHPEGHRPPNAVPATERRFLTQPHAERHPEFRLTPTQIDRERRLGEQLGSGRGILEVRLLGNDSNPALLRWVFEQLHEPFPLLSTTLDAIFAANARACHTVTEAEKQVAPRSDDSDWSLAEDDEDDSYN